MKPVTNAVHVARLRKKMSQQELARLADCSIKTIKSIEAGKCCYESTLLRISKALNCPFEQLTVGYLSSLNEKPPSYSKATLSNLVPFEEFDETADVDALIERIRTQLQIKHTIYIVCIRKGSVDITFYIHNADLLRLVATLLDDVWGDLKLGNLRIHDDNLVHLLSKYMVGVIEETP